MISIIINNNKEVDIKATKGLEETELAANAAVEIMRNMVSWHKPEDNGKYYLVLTWVDQNCKLGAVKEIKENLDLWLKDAKHFVDSYFSGNRDILFTGNEDEVTKTAKKFDDSNYVKVGVLTH